MNKLTGIIIQNEKAPSRRFMRRRHFINWRSTFIQHVIVPVVLVACLMVVGMQMFAQYVESRERTTYWQLVRK